MKESVVAYLSERFCTMERDGFPLLRKIPSYEASRFPVVFASLTNCERDTFRTFAAKRGASMFGYDCDSADGERFFGNLLPRLLDRSHFPAARSPMAKAAELRREAKLAFAQLLGAVPRKSEEPGDWFYTGLLSGRSVTVEMRYSTRMAPLCYRVFLDNDRISQLNFEMLYGFGIGTWDLISVDALDRAFAALKEVVTVSVGDALAIHRLSEKNI